jgi:hypothetical protein
MANDERQTEAESTGEQLPEPPTYDLPYEPGDAGYDMAEKSGYYGVMYAGDYEWNNVRCTAEAYGEYDATARPGNRRKSIDGQSRRSLKFHSTWMDVETAKECVRNIGPYNRFDPARVHAALDDMPEPIRVCVGREGSPSLYVWTLQPCAVMDAINGDEPYIGIKGEVDDDLDGCPPDELGGIPEAETYPDMTVGKARKHLSDGVPTLIRCWWD